MYYGNIKKFDIANGEGIRVSLFVSGCRNRCKNCFNPETWAFDYGKPFDEVAENIIFDALKNGSVRGVSILGGEPMEPENQADLYPFLLRLKEKFPDKTVWLYTGNLYEELTSPVGTHPKATDVTVKILDLVDILVDGRFIEEEKELGLRFRGSKNQRIIDMNKTRENGTLTIWHGVAEDKSYKKE